MQVGTTGAEGAADSEDLHHQPGERNSNRLDSKPPRPPTSMRMPSLDAHDLVSASRSQQSELRVQSRESSSMKAFFPSDRPAATSPLGVRSSHGRSSTSCSDHHMQGTSLRVNLGQGTDTTSSTMNGTTSSWRQVPDLGNSSTWAPELAHVARTATGAHACILDCGMTHVNVRALGG